MKTSAVPVFDLSSIGLSLLCLIHCLAMPVAVAFLPVMSAWAEAEWLHLAFVAVAAPCTFLALFTAHRRRPLPAGVVMLAGGGLLGLVLGVAGIPTESAETMLTVAGSLLLASAHVWNWSRHRPPCGT